MPIYTTPDGVSVNYYDSETPGPVVLLQHGFSNELGQVLDVTPQMGIRLVAMELRGHGRSQSGQPDFCTISQSCLDLKILCHKLEISPDVIGGISLGAAIALRLATLIECEHLVLARPALFDHQAPSNFAIFGAILDITTSKEKSEWRKCLEANPTFQKLKYESPATVDTYTKFLEHPRIDDLHYWMYNLESDWHGLSIEEMRNISAQTTILAQRFDQLHPFSFAEALAKTIPAASLIELSPKTSDQSTYQMEFQSALRTIFTSIQQRKAR